MGTIKDIPGVRTYVAVDGGMSDNPRPVLYGSGYEAFLPREVEAPRPRRARVVGKHCESGDVLLFDAQLPDDLVVGDLLAVPVTGAYGHSMGSNYNKVTRPPVVFVANGRTPPGRAPGDDRRPARHRRRVICADEPRNLDPMPRLLGRRAAVRCSASSPRSATPSATRGVRRDATTNRPGPSSRGCGSSTRPALDGDPDPGEVVWTWVPFEDDPTLGKDRPVVIIGRHGDDLSGVALTSKQTGRDDHVEVGSGPWDAHGRTSYAKVDRLLDIDPRDVRREGAILNRRSFDAVIQAVERRHDLAR